MTARRKFLRDCLMGIAISLVPKILQPVVPELPEYDFLLKDFRVTLNEMRLQSAQREYKIYLFGVDAFESYKKELLRQGIPES